MGALQLAIFIIPYLRAVNVLAQTPDKLSERLSVRQELALQERNNAPPLVAQLSTRADGSPYFDPTNENYPIALSLSSVETTTTTTTTKPDLIVANDPPCSPANYPITTGGKLKRRGGKQRRGGATTKPESLCPLPATTTTTTDTDTHPPQTDGQQPQTEEKGQEQGGQVPHDGSPQPEELKWPNLFRIPTNDGDSPACFEATNGLMPVGVCENPQQQPEPSRWDIFMQVNRNVDPQAWKLPDSTLAWPGMRECVPRYKGGIWCCRFYTVLIDGSGFGDICWPLAAVERINQNGQAPWQQFMNPLLPGP